ncbi:MAG: hypothetical protein ABSC32_11600, partial [Steroidobacteraceae bacterium]
LVLLVTDPSLAVIIPPFGAELAMDKLLDQVSDRAGAGPLLPGSLFRVLSLFTLLDGVEALLKLALGLVVLVKGIGER